MSEQDNLTHIQSKWHGSYRSYIIGFVASLFLTGIAYFFVFTKYLESVDLIFTLAALAFIQAIVQLIFFLHVGKEAKPRWELLISLFMVLVLAIIVLGSLWIMLDLNERVMKGM